MPEIPTTFYAEQNHAMNNESCNVSGLSPCSRIILLKPVAAESVSNICPQWRALLQARKDIQVDPDAPPLDYKESTGFPVPVPFVWKTEIPPPYCLDISTDSAFQAGQIFRSFCTTGCCADVYNLETGRNYYWRVTAGGCVSQTGHFITANDAIRQVMVAPSGPVNTRDWGGKAIRGGGRTRQGAIYRGSMMHEPFALTDEARKVLVDELGIRTELDLRYNEEVAFTGTTESPVGQSVNWLHCPINAYNCFLPENHDVQFPIWRGALQTFADKANFPIYVHCWGGADRTGEVALLLDFLLDVDEEQAFLDYEFSSLANMPRPRSIGYLQEWLANLESYAPAQPRMNQAENWMRALGLTKHEISEIRDNLTERP